MLTVPAKRPIPPEASVKVPVIGTVIPAGGGIARAKAFGTVNIPNSTAISATVIILLLIGLPSYVRNVSGLGAYFALRTDARERLRVRQTNRFRFKGALRPSHWRHGHACVCDRQLGIQKLSDQFS